MKRRPDGIPHPWTEDLWPEIGDPVTHPVRRDAREDLRAAIDALGLDHVTHRAREWTEYGARLDDPYFQREFAERMAGEVAFEAAQRRRREEEQAWLEAEHRRRRQAAAALLLGCD